MYEDENIIPLYDKDDNRPNCEVCGFKFEKLVEQYFPKERTHKMVCNGCYFREIDRQNTERILSQKQPKRNIRIAWDINDWVTHLKNKHGISSLKLENSIQEMYKSYKEIKKVEGYTNEFRKIAIKFLQELDQKLHYVPYAMSEKCYNYDNKNRRCNNCRTYYPNCYKFTPTELFYKFEKAKRIQQFKENKKQQKLEGLNDTKTG